MTPLDLLQKRVSVGKLQAPGPDDSQILEFIKAAMRAADHGNLTPWRFIAIREQGLIKLGDLFANAAVVSKPSSTAEELQRFKSLPLRAPLIITVVAQIQEHPKIPRQEQLLSAAAAAQNLLNAAFMSGWGAIWRTGDIAYDPAVADALGLGNGEQIIGFIYIGTPAQLPGEPRVKSPQDFLSYWQ